MAARGGRGACAAGGLVQPRDQISDHDTDEDWKQAWKTAQVHGGDGRGEEGDGAGDQILLEVGDGNAGQRDPDYGHDRAGHHRRHQESDDVDAGEVDDDSDQKVDDAGDQDPGERQSLVLAGPALDREHRTDERERRAEVAGYLAAGDDEEDERPDAAEENHGVRVETEDQRDQYRGAEHRHHVLNP